jgi:membrane-bound lytic murein transglycosylase B
VGKTFGLFVGVLFSFVSLNAQAQSEDVDFAAWDAFIEGVRVEAIANGISEDIVMAATADIQPLKRAIALDRKQPEFKQTSRTYMDKRVSAFRVQAGQEMMATHAELLAAIAEKYGVQARYIVAIWGMETNYGRFVLKTDAIRALATMAFDKRRGAFFRKELMAALQILDEGHVTLENMKGSWAGAMGQSQFMPTSFLGYAQDGNGDGRRDIWADEADVFASIAHYLARHGWKDDHSWGREVLVPAGFVDTIAELSETPPPGCRAMKRHTQRQSLAEWQGLGLRRLNGQDLPKRDLMASLVHPDGVGGPAFLAYGNYKAILGYNCANLYALSVGHLAEKIK